MRFRYFDPAGNQMTLEELRSMGIMTPAMDHVFATVLARMEKNGKSRELIEKISAE